MLYIKALHIIFIVTWFAGLFYIVRLFIYATEANERPEAERKVLQQQYKIMSARLWKGITIPSAVLTAIFGPLTMYVYGYFDDFGAHTWLHIKLLFVILLYVYFFTLHKIFSDQQKGIFKWTSTQLRVWNEVATIFLVAIVMLVVVKSSMSLLWGLGGLIAFIIVLMSAIKIYKNIRSKKS